MQATWRAGRRCLALASGPQRCALQGTNSEINNTPEHAAGDVESWTEQFGADQWATEFARAAGGAAGAAGPRTRQEGYQFAADNPYLQDADSFAKVSAFAARASVVGRLHQAMQCSANT